MHNCAVVRLMQIHYFSVVIYTNCKQLFVEVFFVSWELFCNRFAINSTKLLMLVIIVKQPSTGLSYRIKCLTIMCSVLVIYLVTKT